MSDFEIESTDNDPFDSDIDPSIEELTGVESFDRTAIIRTSDRGGFKRCRRRWNWQSHLRGNLTTIEGISPLWFGTGVHFALEDFHGIQSYEHPRLAFEDYVRATYRQEKATGKKIPYNWPDLVTLGRGMLEYYADTWLIARDPLPTFIWNGVPQVEVHAIVEVPYSNQYYDKVFYAVTMDRIVIGNDGKLYIVDYKTAARIQTQFFQTDPQISAYCWIASCMYPGYEIGGFIYQQHRKVVPELPRILGNGTISASRTQITSHRLYRKGLINLYGDVARSPSANIETLNWLAQQETPEWDRFIRRDKVYRNQHQVEAEGVKLLLELPEMLDRNLPLYPTPTRECGNMCSFNSACVSMDDGGDWEDELKIGFKPKEANFDSWRKYLPQAKPITEQFVSLR